MHKRIIIAFLLVLGLILLSSCGNRQVGIDTNQSFTRAYINLNNNWVELTLKSWRDFENSDTVQIIDAGGTVYLTHYSNVVLMSR